MLRDKFKNIAQDEKIIDKNDFWLIENNPLTKIGVFPYLGRQISDTLEPNTIYNVLRPEEELTREETLKSLELIPLVDEHTMLGNKAGHQPAEEKGIHGVTGTNVQVSNPLITNDLKIYSEALKDEIKSGKKGLSGGYYCDYDLTSGEFNGEHYDAIQRNIIFNHIALVDEGRMGKDVRVMDSKITYDSFFTKEDLQNKEQTMEKEKQAQDVDKRELIREVMAIAAKPNEDFEGGEEEKIETIAKKLEEMSYNKSEAGNNDEDLEKEEKKVVVEKEKAEDEEEEKKPCEDEDDEDKDCDKEKAVSMDEVIKEIAKRDVLVQRLRPEIGENANFPSMNVQEVVKYACDKLDIPNSLEALEGYLKAKSQSRAKFSMDSAYQVEEKSNFLKEYLK